MKEANIPFSTKEVNWETIPKLAIQEKVRPRESDATAYAQICYTEDALQVRLTANEPEILRNEADALGMPCRDSCLEFFFCPQEGDLRYFNLNSTQTHACFWALAPALTN